MFTPDDVEELFDKRKAPDNRWTFTPAWNNPVKGYRYALTFIPAERRFALSRQKIQPFDAVDDDALLQAFRSNLADEEIAACMRAAINRDADFDEVPF